MNSLYLITIDDYLEVVRRSQEAGLLPGDDMTPILVQYMNEKGQRPCMNTELNKEELLNDLSQKHRTILDITTNDCGQQSYNIIKKKDEESGLNFD
jgi:hypothetical protein